MMYPPKINDFENAQFSGVPEMGGPDSGNLHRGGGPKS